MNRLQEIRAGWIKYALGALVATCALFVAGTALAQEDVGPVIFVCFLGDCDANTSNEGGDHHNVNLADHLAEARAQGNAGSEQSAFAEVGLRFRPCFTGPVEIRYFNIEIQGQLRGFGGGNLNYGEVTVRAIMRDVTDEDNIIELESEELYHREELGDPAVAVQFNVNTDVDWFEFDTDVVDGHVYDVVVRVDVRKDGLLAWSDFQTGNRGVSFHSIWVVPELEDTDGDGLYDVWETSGVDRDCDDDLELNLPAMGANPALKDVFLELDWMVGGEPQQAQVRAVVDAFAAAPPDAAANTGGAVTPGVGVRLWVDTGNLTDPAASENGAGPNTCSDGIDNSPPGSPDNLADENDPDCLVGALAFSSLAGGAGLGEGNGFAVGGIPDVNADADADGESDFVEAKNDPARGNWDSNRALAFRYAISGFAAGPPPTFTGQANGNNFVLFSRSAALTMHEFGHTLGLNHGGPESTINCQPNYLSIMNYRYGGGIQVAGGIGAGQDIDGDGTGDGRILDFSPPRFPGGRGIAPVPVGDVIDETAWDETADILDVSDASNIYAWATTDRQLVTAQMNANPDWNNDGDTNDQAGPAIDFNTSFWNPAAAEGAGSPANTCNDGVDNDGVNGMDANDPACNGNSRCGLASNAAATQHPGADDWRNLELDPAWVLDVGEGEVPLWIDEPTEEDIEFAQEAMQTTDLLLSDKIASPDPAMAGQEIVYTMTVTNTGPNRAGYVVVRDQLPEELTFVEGEPACTANASGLVRCTVGEVPVGASREVRIVARVRADLVCEDGEQFVEIANVANAVNRFGPDLDPSNNRTRLESDVLCRRYEYAAKIVCGIQDNPEDLLLTRGGYATTVNVHNPNDEQVYFFKKLALTFPPQEQAPGDIYAIGIDSLAYDQALKTDCNDIRRLFPDGELPAPYIEGFVVVQSAFSLDVVGVYTAMTLNQQGMPAEQSGIHIEPIAEREIEVGGADLEVEKTVELPNGSSTTNLLIYRVMVTNHGPADAVDVLVSDALTVDPGVLLDLPGALFTATHGSGWTVLSQDQDSAELEATIPVLQPDETATLEFAALVIIEATSANRLEAHIVNEAEAESETSDPDLENNSDSTETHIAFP